MNVMRHHQFVELVPPAPTQTEVIHAHAWKGLKWLTAVALVSYETDREQVPEFHCKFQLNLLL